MAGIAGSTLKLRAAIQALLDAGVSPTQVYEIFLTSLADYKNK